MKEGLTEQVTSEQNPGGVSKPCGEAGDEHCSRTNSKAAWLERVTEGRAVGDRSESFNWLQ